MTTTITKANAMKLSSRFNRGNQNSVLSAAVRLAALTGKTQFVFPTYSGLTISTTQPSCGRFFAVSWISDLATVETIG